MFTDLTKGDFTKPLPPLSALQKIHFDFLKFELKNSVTAQAHKELMATLLLQLKHASIISPDALKAEAWKYFEAAGLSVSVFFFFFFFFFF